MVREPELTEYEKSLKKIFELSKPSFKRKYQNGCLWFVENILSISNIDPQQKQLIDEVNHLIYCKEKFFTHNKCGDGTKEFKKYYKDPITPEEIDIARRRGISIRSGKGCGKDAAVSWVVMWFMMMFPRSLIPCTAPVSDQLRIVLWREIYKWMKMTDSNGEHKFPLHHMYEMDQDYVYLKEHKKKSNYAVARVAKETADGKSDTLQGLHENYMMFIIEEASGVPAAVFDAFETTLTRPINFVIMIWNPVRRSGYAYESHYSKDSENWINLHWNAEKSSIVDPKSIADMAKKYGKESNEYRINVLGLPPYSDDNNLVPYEWIDEAKNRDIEVSPHDPLLIGVDCAFSGKNEAVIVIRRGPEIVEFRSYPHVDKTEQLVDFVLLAIKDYPDFDSCYIDKCGPGKGVFDGVKRYYPHKIRGVDVSEGAKDKERFRRLRDELWWKIRKRFENGNICMGASVEQHHAKKFFDEIRQGLASRCCCIPADVTRVACSAGCGAVHHRQFAPVELSFIYFASREAVDLHRHRGSIITRANHIAILSHRDLLRQLDTFQFINDVAALDPGLVRRTARFYRRNPHPSSRHIAHCKGARLPVNAHRIDILAAFQFLDDRDGF